MENKKNIGFTMLEILLVVAAIAILAGIVIVAINPGKQLADTRNAHRRSSVRTIMDSVYQYAIDNSGALPSQIPLAASSSCGDAANEICITGADCTGLVELHEITDNGIYLVVIPEDLSAATENGTGFHIVKEQAMGRITVCAPHAEFDAVIDVKK